jgi:hypothetical protein
MVGPKSGVSRAHDGVTPVLARPYSCESCESDGPPRTEWLFPCASTIAHGWLGRQLGSIVRIPPTATTDSSPFLAHMNYVSSRPNREGGRIPRERDVGAVPSHATAISRHLRPNSSHVSYEKIQTGVISLRARSCLQRVLCESPVAVEARKKRAGIRQRSFRPQGVEGLAKSKEESES